MRRNIIAPIMFVLLLNGPFAAGAVPLQGDKEAISLVERMLDTLGGKRIWGKARTIRMELNGYFAREQEPWHETFWMDLVAPRGRFELHGGSVDRVIAWTPKDGWELDTGELKALTADRHAFELEYWKRQPVVIFRRLAAGTPATRVALGDNEFRFDVFEAESDTLLAQFAVNMKGEPIKWGTSIDDREFEHFFGPLEDFGDLRLPRWGGSISAVWRYEQISASLSPEEPHVSFEPPAHTGKKTPSDTE